jgi:hypothetical protein
MRALTRSHRLSACLLTALLVLAGASLSLQAADALAGKRGKTSRTDIDGDGIRNTRDRDIDGDRRGNGRDRDVDGDRVPNRRDRDIDADRRRNGRDRDMDADRRRNGCADRDIDGDGRRNSRDRDMDADRLANTRDRDIDGDGRLNRRDTDMDGDCVVNYDDDDADGSGNPPPVVAGKVPADFFGMVSEDVFGMRDGVRDSVLSDIRRAGAGNLRKIFSWREIEKLPGRYSFEVYDLYVAEAARRNLALVGILFDPPAFRSSKPSAVGTRLTYPPADYGAFARYAAATVRRYGPRGSFWREHPQLPYRPVRSWQVWNEPNFHSYWPTGVNAGQYVSLLKQTYRAVKAADPSVEVVSGGLPESTLGVPVEAYVSQMYAHGARGSFDSLGLHPYAGSADGVMDVIAKIRRLMLRHGDRSAIRITEVGWGTAGPRNQQFNVGPEAQAGLIRRTLRHIVARREELGIRAVTLYCWRDMPPYGGQADFWGLYAGLVDRQGRPKPSYWAFRDAVASLSG